MNFSILFRSPHFLKDNRQVRIRLHRCFVCMKRHIFENVSLSKNYIGFPTVYLCFKISYFFSRSRSKVCKIGFSEIDFISYCFAVLSENIIDIDMIIIFKQIYCYFFPFNWNKIGFSEIRSFPPDLRRINVSFEYIAKESNIIILIFFIPF